MIQTTVKAQQWVQVGNTVGRVRCERQNSPLHVPKQGIHISLPPPEVAVQALYRWHLHHVIHLLLLAASEAYESRVHTEGMSTLDCVG